MFLTTGLQGKQPRIDISFDGETLIAIDRKTGEKLPVKRVKDKWRVTIEDKYSYLTSEQIDKRLIRKQLDSIPKELLDKRNNVEAAMFQVSFHTRNNKTRYRGLLKHSLWADARCLWINFVRLMIFQITVCQRTIFDLYKAIVEFIKAQILSLIETLLTPNYYKVAKESRKFGFLYPLY